MITNWKLFNFKSFRDETDLELGPLTVLAGANSSGKSTVLQSMLMIGQTLSSQVESHSVVLNGPLVKLGQFNDLRSFESGASQILIGWRCAPSVRNAPIDDSEFEDRISMYYGWEKLDAVSCEVAFDVDTSSADYETQQLRPRLYSCSVGSEVTVRRAPEIMSLTIRRSDEPIGARIAALELADRDSPLAAGLGYEIELSEELELEPRHFRRFAYPHVTPTVTPVGAETKHFLPARIIGHTDINELQAFHITSALLADRPVPSFMVRDTREAEVPDEVLAIIEEVLDDEASQLPGRDLHQPSLFPSSTTIVELVGWLRKLPARTRASLREKLEAQEDLFERIREALVEQNGTKYMLGMGAMPQGLHESTSYLEWFFSRGMKYLGPLRDDPKPLYPLAANVDPTDIGLRGEHTAAVLDLHKEKFVRFIPSRAFASKDNLKSPTTRRLRSAVLDWLEYMGIAEEIETLDRGKLGHELKVMTPGTRMPHDLTHVGVGVSQVLPILVMCLLAEPDTTIIIEQPELHLHPKVQTLLGDFFLSMALLDKQIIVETHSEYIVNRLRFRAAEADGEQLSSLMKIYFAEKEQGSSVFREVNVNQYGAIRDWPKGFFDQSQEEADRILRSAIEKKERSRKSRLEKRDE